MELKLTARDVELESDDRFEFKTRVRRILAKSPRRMDHVSVYLEDVNGPKGGLDQQCRIKAVVRGLGNIDAVGHGRSTMAAAHQAASTLVGRIRRVRSRKQSRGRRVVEGIRSPAGAF